MGDEFIDPFDVEKPIAGKVVKPPVSSNFVDPFDNKPTAILRSAPTPADSTFRAVGGMKSLPGNASLTPGESPLTNIR